MAPPPFEVRDLVESSSNPPQLELCEQETTIVRGGNTSDRDLGLQAAGPTKVCRFFERLAGDDVASFSFVQYPMLCTPPASTLILLIVTEELSASRGQVESVGPPRAERLAHALVLQLRVLT